MKTILTKGKRYICIEGEPFSGYTGTVTFSSLKIVSAVNTLKEVEKEKEHLDDYCAGLYFWLDTKTMQGI